jgi:hypothetical protein
MTVDSPVYTFVWSAGTENADVYRVALDANTQDYQIFLNDDTTPAFLAGQGTSKIVLGGAAGDDSLTIDLTNGNPITPQGLIFDGGIDNDTINVVASDGADSVTFDPSSIVINGSTVTQSDTESFSYDGAGGYDTLAVNAGATVTLAPTTQRFGSLSVDGNVFAAPGASSGIGIVTRSLTLGASATLDLTNNDMLIDPNSGRSRNRGRGGGGNTPGQIQALINSARNGGAWDGVGITSTTAREANPHNTTLGLLTGAEYQSVYGAGATFDGEALTEGSILVKYTYYGDTDFNGQVNFDDYSRTDAGFNQGRSGWLNGDSDGNGVVNFDDYSLIDLAFNTQTSIL